MLRGRTPVARSELIDTWGGYMFYSALFSAFLCAWFRSTQELLLTSLDQAYLACCLACSVADGWMGGWVRRVAVMKGLAALPDFRGDCWRGYNHGSRDEILRQ